MAIGSEGKELALTAPTKHLRTTYDRILVHLYIWKKGLDIVWNDQGRVGKERILGMRVDILRFTVYCDSRAMVAVTYGMPK